MIGVAFAGRIMSNVVFHNCIAITQPPITHTAIFLNCLETIVIFTILFLFGAFSDVANYALYTLILISTFDFVINLG